MEQSELCRVCNIVSDNCLQLFKPLLISGELTTLAKVLSSCSGLKLVEAEDFLPQHICQVCATKLRRFWEFKRAALKTDGLLRQRHYLKEEEYFYVMEEGEDDQSEPDLVQAFVLDQDQSRDQELDHEESAFVVKDGTVHQDELEIKVEEELAAKLWKRSIADLEVHEVQDVIIEETSQSDLFMEEEDTQDPFELARQPAKEQQPPAPNPTPAKTKPTRGRPKKTTNPCLKCQVSKVIDSSKDPPSISRFGIPDLRKATEHQQLLQVPHAAAQRREAVCVPDLRRVLQDPERPRRPCHPARSEQSEHMPHLRQGVPAGVVTAHPPADPQRHQAVRVRDLWEASHPEVGLQEAHAHPHRREAARM